MALAKMGIEAVMDVAGFQRGAKAYDAQLAKSSSATTKAAGQFDKDLNQIQTKSASVFGKMAAIAGGILGAQVIGKALSAVKGFATGAIAAGADATEMISKFGVTFGKETDRMNASLTEFGKITGRSRYDLMAMAADFGAVTKAIGFNESASADLSLEMAQLAVDVGSFMNVQSPEVMARFRSALTGETESLKTLGIVINQDMIKAEALNTGLVATSVDMGKVKTAQLGVEAATKRTADATKKYGADSIQARKAADAQAKAEGKLSASMEGQTGAISQQAKAMAVRNLLMRMTKDAQGDAARTADSWANQTVKLNATWKDFQTDLGLGLTQGLGPVLQVINRIAGAALPALVTSLNSSVIPAIGKFASKMVETIDAIEIGWAEGGSTLGKAVGIFTNVMGTVMGQPLPETMIDSMWKFVRDTNIIRGKLTDAFASQKTLAGGAAVFMQAIGIPQDIRSRVYKVLDPLEKGIKARILKIQAAVLLSYGAGNTTAKLLAAIGVPESITSKIPAAFASVEKLAKDGWKRVQKIAKDMPLTIAKAQTKVALGKEAAGGILGKLTAGMDLGGIGKVVGDVGGAFKKGGIGGAISEAMGSAPDVLGTLGTLKGQLVNNLFDMGGEMLTALSTQFPGLAPIIEGGLKPLLEFGKTLFTSFSQLKGAAFDGLIAMLPALFTALGTAVKMVTPILPQLVTAVLSLITAMLPLITSMLPPLITLFTQVVTTVLPPLVALLPQIIPPILGVVAALLPMIAQVLPLLITLFMQVVQSILPPLLALLPQLIPPILSLITSIMPLIVQTLPMLIELFTTVIGTILPPLTALLLAVIPPVVDLVAALVPLIMTILPPLIELFSALIGLGLDIALLAIEVAAGLVVKIVEKVTEWVGKAADKFGGLSISVKKVTDGIGKFGEWLSKIKLPSWLTPGSPTPMEMGLRGIAAAMGPVVDEMLAFAKSISGPQAAAMKNVASAFKDMAKGIDEMSGALLKIGEFQGTGGSTAGFGGWIDQFVEIATMAAARIEGVIELIGYNRIKKLQLTARRLKDVIAAVLVDLSAIKERSFPDLGVWFNQLQDVFHRAVVVMNVIHGKWGRAVIERAAAVASLVGQVLAVLGTELGKAVPPPPDYEGILDAFLGGLEMAMNKIMPKLSDIWVFFGGPGLNEAVKTVAAVTEIVGVLSLASVLGELVNAKTALEQDFGPLLDMVLAAIALAVNAAIPMLLDVQEQWGEALETVDGIAGKIADVLGILGIDLAKIIPPPVNFPALLGGFLAALVMGVNALVPMLRDVRAQIGGTVLDEAALTAKALEEIIGILSLADVFAGISKPENAIKNNFTKMVQKILAALTSAVDILIPGLQSINAKWGAVLEEVIKIAQSMAAVFGGVNDAQTAALEFSKSGNLDLNAFVRKIATLNAATAAAVAGLSIPTIPVAATAAQSTSTASSRGGLASGSVNVSSGPVVVNIYGAGGNLIQTYTQATNAAGQVDIKLAEGMSTG